MAATVEVAEFGRMGITVDGADVSPGLNKSVELLAFLANQDGRTCPARRLLDALFDGRRDDSASVVPAAGGAQAAQGDPGRAGCGHQRGVAAAEPAGPGLPPSPGA